jgi:hypothetical protein
VWVIIEPQYGVSEQENFAYRSDNYFLRRTLDLARKNSASPASFGARFRAEIGVALAFFLNSAGAVRGSQLPQAADLRW